MREDKTGALTVTEAHIVLVVTFALYMGFSWLTRHEMVPGGPVVIMVAGQMLLSLPALIYMRLRKIPVGEALQLNSLTWDNMKMAVMVLVCSYPLVGVLNFLTMLFVENEVSDLLNHFMPYGLQISVILMALLPAFNEEILCRGVIYGSYRRRSPLKGIFLSAIIFGVFHLNLNQLPYACLLGVIFALMNEATGSTLTSVLMHFLLNAFNVVMNFMAAGQGMTVPADPVNYRELFAQDPDIMRSMLLTAAIVLAGFVPLTIIMIRKTFMMNQTTIPRTKGRLLDPLVVLFLAVAVWLTWKNTNFFN